MLSFYSDILKIFPEEESSKLKKSLTSFTKDDRLDITPEFSSSLNRPNTKRGKKNYYIGDPDIVAILRFSIRKDTRLFLSKSFMNCVLNNEEEFILNDGSYISTVDLWSILCDVISLRKNFEVMFESEKLKPYGGSPAGELSMPHLILNLQDFYVGRVFQFDEIENLVRTSVRLAESHMQKTSKKLRNKDQANRMRICLMGVGQLVENIKPKEYEDVAYLLEGILSLVKLVADDESKDLADAFGGRLSNGKRHSKIIGSCGNYLHGLLEHLEWSQQIELQKNIRPHFDYPIPCYMTQEEETTPMDVSELLIQCMSGKLDGFCFV